jgi:site-specific DNA-methyltransferase (adenine-specific)
MGKSVIKKTIGNCEVYLGDCLDILPALDRADAVITDPPYGVTACKWDIAIDLNIFWSSINYKENAPLLLFSAQPFSTDCINSYRKFYRYSWYWIKNTKTGFLNANKMPMRSVEEILVFYKRLPIYNPQKQGGRKVIPGIRFTSSTIYKNNSYMSIRKDTLGFPTNTLFFNSIITGFTGNKRLHPTQKPVELLEYLIKTYSNSDDLILDPFMGSGSTAIACINTGRKFIGIEKDNHFFDVACKRIENAYNQAMLDFGEPPNDTKNSA